MPTLQEAAQAIADYVNETEKMRAAAGDAKDVLPHDADVWSWQREDGTSAKLTWGMLCDLRDAMKA